MPKDMLEIVSRGLLPEGLRHGELEIDILPAWTEEEVRTWTKDQYWFQGFPWAPVQRADSSRVWRCIQPVCSWSNRTVLDIGTHYGFFALRAAQAGASVLGMDIDSQCIRTARLIDDHIEQQGVAFQTEDPGGPFDVILYLSVHHQIDPTYNGLQAKVKNLSSRCQDLFVELILPHSQRRFGAGRTAVEVDVLVGGQVLDTYRHRVRGERRIWHVPGRAK